MKYDRDIRWMRIGLWVIVAVNLIFAGWCLYAHRWVDSIACLIWTANVRMHLGTLATQQVTRDRSRLVEAAVQGVLED